MTENAAATTFTFDGTEVGGVESWQLLQGQVREAVHRPLDGASAARPLEPDYGQCILNLYRDRSDAGQTKLVDSLANLSRHTMVITHEDGSTDTFTAFTVLFPEQGSRSSGTPISLTRCVLRVDGRIT